MCFMSAVLGVISHWRYMQQSSPGLACPKKITSYVWWHTQLQLEHVAHGGAQLYNKG